jgi:hypothetical protein
MNPDFQHDNADYTNVKDIKSYLDNKFGTAHEKVFAFYNVTMNSAPLFHDRYPEKYAEYSHHIKLATIGDTQTDTQTEVRNL